MATSLSQEDINFLRLAGLLIRVAPRAVRRRFDFEFHPKQLQQFLSKNRHKIDDLTHKKRVITLAQYDLLYPRGTLEVSSAMFDVSLMVCLLRHFIDLEIQDSLPIATIHTVAADISRIKIHRNSIVHSDSGKVQENKFSEIWNCVAEAILRLAPEIKSEIDALISSSLTNVTDILDFIRLEKQLEKTNQHMVAINKKLETLEIEKIIKQDFSLSPEIQLKTLKEWRNTDKKYISTSATTFIKQSLNKIRGVIILGSPGCGKSATAHHVALELEKKNYEILPCDDPLEIVKCFTTTKSQVFVIDDVCGKFSLNQQKADSWEQNNDRLNTLIESCNQNDDDEDNSSKQEAKFIITCRESIFVHKAFPKLTCFSLAQCSFSTKYKISPEEMSNIALSYVSESTVNDIENICLYDFFPLICSLYSKSFKKDPSYFIHPIEIIGDEISEMKNKSESCFLCISLLVLRNNSFLKNELRSEDVQQLVKAICWDCKIESVSIVAILNSFERLKGVYITESDDIYTAIHDKMFDIIAAAIAPSIMKCLIEHVDIAFLANRTHLSSFTQNSVPFVIHIPHQFESLYLKRQMKEAMTGKYWEVFGSIQTENEAYRKLLLSFLKEQDTCQQISYGSVKDGNTALYVSSQLGYIDFVEYFVVKCPNHIDIKDNEGRSPFYVACEKGHIAVVSCLMKYNEDINVENADNTTALSATCLNGHTDVAQLLLDNNADINILNKLNQDTLHFACLYGNVKLLNLLLFGEYNVDILNTDTVGQTALHAACKNGHTETVKTLMDFGMDVNKKDNEGRTPLYHACSYGCYDTVNMIIDYISSKPISSQKTIVDTLNRLHSTNSGYTVLHIACHKGHLELIKLLIDVGMNVNNTSEKGFTPFYQACLEGQCDTVKYLLDLNSKTLHSRVDTTRKDIYGRSSLHATCFKGHTDVVKLLIGVGLNVNETSSQGITPLLEACRNGQYDTVKYFLDLNGQTLNSRVDTTITNENGWSALYVACQNGHCEVVKLLIGAGMNPNDTTHRGSTPLHTACQNGHLEIAKYLIDLNDKIYNSRVDVTTKLENGCSALHLACKNGHFEIIKLLIGAGMNPNDTIKGGSTPLFEACLNGKYDTVKYFLDLNGQTLNSRVDTTITNEKGWSALHVACQHGHCEVVKLLIGAGMNSNDTTNRGSTPLHTACQNGHLEIAKYLMDLNDKISNSRVDVTTKLESGCSALHLACKNGHFEIIKLLIGAGMNPNDTIKGGYTPLLEACWNGQYDTVKYLLDLNGQTLNSCVDTTITNEKGWSALHVACQNGHCEVVKLLIGAGMNPNDPTNRGSTPLHTACQKGHFEIAKYLIDLNDKIFNSRVDVTTKLENGCSALHLACKNGHLEIVKLLIGAGMNPNDTIEGGSTPLHITCWNGHYKIVTYLLDLNDQILNSRVDTTIKDKNGRTALHAACLTGHAEILKLLIDVGMNINERDNYRRTAAYLACVTGHSDIVKILKDNCAELHIWDNYRHTP